jgi:hypothetical protein
MPRKKDFFLNPRFCLSRLTLRIKGKRGKAACQQETLTKSEKARMKRLPNKNRLLTHVLRKAVGLESRLEPVAGVLTS